MLDVIDVLASKEGLIIFYSSIMFGMLVGFILGWYHRGREKRWEKKWWIITGIIILVIVAIRIWFLFRG